MSNNSSSEDIIDQKFNIGPWNSQESLKYLVFLDENKIVMASRQKKKKFRVFDQMSDFVQSRSSLQCRSHHQKAIEKYKEVKQIINHQKQESNFQNYRLRFKELKEKAKVKSDYQNPQKPNKNLKANLFEDQKQLPNQEYFPVFGTSIVPSFFSLFPGNAYSMMPINPQQIMTNCYFYSNFPSL